MEQQLLGGFSMYRSIAMGAVLALVSFQAAEAKITIFSNQAVLIHVLTSKELVVARQQSRELTVTDLTQASVTPSGPAAIGAEYKVELTYGTDPRHPSVPTVCTLTATVENEKVPGLRGITASRLSAPKLSKPDCAE
jgi:hypothetical protein